MRRLAAALALCLSLQGLLRAQGTLLALCYHRFGPEKAGDDYQISVERFEAQLAWLKSEGWKPAKLAQAQQAAQGSLGEGKWVLLSIDDGYKAGALGAAALERQGYSGVFFVYPNPIGRSKSWLGWEELKGLEASGHEVASHSFTHPNLARPEKGESRRAYQYRVRHELKESKVRLEKGLGHEVQALAYPFGAYDPYVEAQARTAGYTLGFSVSGGVVEQGDPALRLRRLLVLGRPALEPFKSMVASQLGARPLVRGLEEGAMYVPAEVPARVQVKAAGQAIVSLGAKRLVKGEGGYALGQVKPGFHFLKVETKAGAQQSTHQILFQVIPAARAGYYKGQ